MILSTYMMKRWNIYCNFILRNLYNKGYENVQLPKIVSNEPVRLLELPELKIILVEIMENKNNKN